MPDGGRQPDAPDVVQPQGDLLSQAPDVVHVEGGDPLAEAPDVVQPQGDPLPEAPDVAQPEPRDAPAEAAEARVAAPKARHRKAAAAPEHWLKGTDAPFAPEVQLTPVRESPAAQEPGAAEQRREPPDAPAAVSPPPERPPPSPLATTLRSFAARCTRARRRAAIAMASLRRAARRLARAAARSRTRRPSSPRPARRGGGKLLLALVASNTCLLSVVLAALARDSSTVAEPPVSVERARAEPAAPARPAVDRTSPYLPTLAVSEIVVRLRDHPADPAPLRARGRFVRIALELQFPDENAKRAMSERLPKLRDVLRAYLSARTAQELRGGRGIQSAKMGLLERVLETAPGVPVRGLYVSQFLLQ